MRRRAPAPGLPGLLGAALLGSLLGPALSGCDAAPGPPADPGPPPVVSPIALSPQEVLFESVQDGDSARIALDFEVEASGSVAAVAFAIVPQFADACVVGNAPRLPVAEGVQEDGPGRYRFSPTFAVAREDVGLFDVTVAAFDAEGRRSNRAVAVVRVIADPLGPPVLSAESTPTVQLPGAGTRTFTLSVAASDPDGPRDLAAVTVDLLGNTFQLFDDGGEGDDAACDGRYSLTLQLAASDDLAEIAGDQPLLFSATDRAGTEATLSSQITFLAP